MQLKIERALERWCSAGSNCVGQILIRKNGRGRFVLCHRDDAERADLNDCGDAATITKFDDAGVYRPLKTAPNLRHGWRIELENVSELRRALDFFYPGRLAILVQFEERKLKPTPLRATLERQSGIYRVAAKLTDAQANTLIANFCRSDGGCLRTILWKRDSLGTIPSTNLPATKFDPSHDQTGKGEQCISLLCQEACNLLVNAARKTVKDSS